MPLCARVRHGLCPPGAYVLGQSKGTTLDPQSPRPPAPWQVGGEAILEGMGEVGDLLQLNPGLKWNLEECALHYKHPHQSAETGLGK